MKKIILNTRRPWNWKVFLLLIGLILPAAFAIIPHSLHILEAYNETEAFGFNWVIIFRNALINGLVIGLLGGLGLTLANRIGLGLPFIEGWIKREPVPYRFRGSIAVGWITGVGFSITILFLEKIVFGPPMSAMFEEIGYIVPGNAATRPLFGFLASISAGITEETIFRLFGLSLLAWIGGQFFHDHDGRPKLTVLWIANLVFALGFGAAHLPGAVTLGWPINALVITRTLVLNGIGGLVLGWLFWTLGLETAMLAHFFGDVILYTMLPIIALQSGDVARNLAITGVVIFVLMASVWAWRILVEENRRYRTIVPKLNDTSPSTSNVRTQGDHAICIQNLSKDFGPIRALDDLSLKIPAGIIFGFLGPNGAGKTTTIRTLLGLLEPTSGAIRVLGFDPQTQADQIRSCTGALLEHTGIYEQMNVEDNLDFYGRIFRMFDTDRKVRIQELLTRMGLWERRKDRAGKLSRGMKQKLALARTMLHRPRLILLDEPTAGLDVQSAVAIREDLTSLAAQEDVTIFLTTHNMADVEKLCHQVAVIQAGRLVAFGSPEELRALVRCQQLEIMGRNFNNSALNLLRNHPQVGAIMNQNNHLVVDLTAETDISELISILVEAGVQVEEVRRTKASLEEVFLSLTGDHHG